MRTFILIVAAVISLIDIAIFPHAKSEENDHISRNALEFAYKIRQVILDKDMIAFQSLHHEHYFAGDPTLTPDTTYMNDPYYLSNIFGPSQRPTVRDFFLKSETKIHIRFHENVEGTKVAAAIYYNPKEFSPRKDYSVDEHAHHWAVNYIETALYLIDGQWKVAGNNFYTEQDPPWVPDYG